jgi:hypothetical protein
MNPLQILFDLTIQFYTMTEQLWLWMNNQTLTILGLNFTPFQLIFNWGTLSIIILAVISKKVVPFL